MFTTTMSTKGQIVISAGIREKLGLEPGQRFLEETKEDAIIIKKLPDLGDMGGMFGKVKGNIKEMMKEVDRGWD